MVSLLYFNQNLSLKQKKFFVFLFSDVDGGGGSNDDYDANSTNKLQVYKKIFMYKNMYFYYFSKKQI